MFRKAVVRDLGKTKSGKQKAAKEARKMVEMKGKQIKDELSSAMIQLFTKLLDEDSVKASTIDDAIPAKLLCQLLLTYCRINSVTGPVRPLDCQQGSLAAVAVRCCVLAQTSTTALV